MKIDIADNVIVIVTVLAYTLHYSGFGSTWMVVFCTGNSIMRFVDSRTDCRQGECRGESSTGNDQC